MLPSFGDSDSMKAAHFAQLFDMADLTQLFLLADSEGGVILSHQNGHMFNIR